MNKISLVKMSIKEVLVEWSESSLINERLGTNEACDIQKTFSLAELSPLFKEAAESQESGYGYDKTKMVVRFIDGSEMPVRLDIDADNYDLAEHVAYYM